MRILVATAPGYGLTLPLVPLAWAARAAGHEVLLATTSEMATVGPAAGLPVADVYPDRDVWGDLMRRVMAGGEPDEDLPEEYRLAAKAGNPLGLFTVTMTAGTIEAGQAFGADLVAHPSDHAAGCSPPPPSASRRSRSATGQVRAEMATQPSPAAVVERIERAL